MKVYKFRTCSHICWWCLLVFQSCYHILNENIYICICFHIFCSLLLVFHWIYYILDEKLYILYIVSYMLMMFVSFSMILLYFGWKYTLCIWFDIFWWLLSVFQWVYYMLDEHIYILYIVSYMLLRFDSCSINVLHFERNLYTLCTCFHICWWFLLIFNRFYYILDENVYALYMFSYILMIVVSFPMSLLHFG